MYPLHALLEHVRQVLALNFPTTLVVTAEVAQVKQSRGHYYLDLIEKNATDGTIVAQVSAVLWGGMYKRLRQQVGSVLDDLLQAGLEIQLHVRVDFHERYGLKLYIEGIDPAYTMGKLAVQRQQTLQVLAAEQLMYRNREQTILPQVVQRVAVISSAEAAGLQDFMTHLDENPYGYCYRVHLFPAAVQGKDAAAEVAAQLEVIGARATAFDCVVIVRGGGARLDLQAFDELILCRAIALCPIPVICGIGHDIDQSVADIVCFASLKTPTATADFLLAINSSFETELQLGLQQIHQVAAGWLRQQDYLLNNLSREIRQRAKQCCYTANEAVSQTKQTLKMLVRAKIQQEKQHLHSLSQLIAALHPQATFARGYSLTTHNRKVVTSTVQINQGDNIETHLTDGKVVSVVS